MGLLLTAFTSTAVVRTPQAPWPWLLLWCRTAPDGASLLGKGEEEEGGGAGKGLLGAIFWQTCLLAGTLWATRHGGDFRIFVADLNLQQRTRDVQKGNEAATFQAPPELTT